MSKSPGRDCELKALVVVESPAKAKTIEKFLGKNYAVKASMGHLRDLPKSQFGVDIENNFTPKYINIRGKGDLIKSLKESAKKADKVFLATDPDREGEAIAWHLAFLLNVNEQETCRIEFNEITKSAIQNAIKHPRQISLPKVDAQQTRRILDRIVGYKLSPLLWRKVRKGLSAGRVQSVAVRLICDREKEIQEFVQQEYWTIEASLKAKARGASFKAELIKIDGQKAEIRDQEQAEAITAELKQAEFKVEDIKRRERRRNPYAPFTTSSLQQDAVRKLGFTTRKTMSIAQQLYEGLDIGSSGAIGLISYMRTDSTRIASSAQQEAREFIEATYGKNFLPEKPPVYSTKKNAQDAHEAVRPTNVMLTPQSIASYLSRDQLKLYTLIWSRFVASQMGAAVYDTIAVDVIAGRFKLRASGSHLKFSGFLSVYNDTKDEQKEQKGKDVTIPDLDKGQLLKLASVLPDQHFTEPPPRYTEASLVKILEEQGIGRPSTYSPIISTIVDRGYVEKVEKKFQPTELGFVVIDLLKEYFQDIVDAAFTANLEKRLDDIAEGEASREKVLAEFYGPFSKTLEYADEAIGHVELPVEVSDVICENCGRNMVVKHGRYGNFLACPGFPACRNTKPILKDTGVKCPKCQGIIVERKTKRGKVFYGCENYPECDYMIWDAPLKETCPTCGSFMVRHRFKSGGWNKICSNNECPTNIKAEKEENKSTTNKVSRRKKSG